VPKAGQENTPEAPKSEDRGVVGGNQPVPVQSKEESRPNVSVPEKQKQTGLVLDWVAVRKEKFRTSDALGKLQPGAVVEIIDIEPWFIRINYQGKEGWIPKQFIKVQQ
jgi:SH3-like domain-containing protein